jgi:hypothetical protein
MVLMRKFGLIFSILFILLAGHSYSDASSDNGNTLLFHAPNGLTFGQYAKLILKDTPYLNEDQYEWQFYLTSYYQAWVRMGDYFKDYPFPDEINAISPLWQESLMAVPACRVPEISHHEVCFLTSDANTDISFFQVRYAREKDLTGRWIPMPTRGELNTFVVNAGLNVWNRKTGNREATYYILPILDRQVFLVPGKYWKDQMPGNTVWLDGVLGNAGIYTCASDSSELDQNFIRDREISANANVGQVRQGWKTPTYFWTPGDSGRGRCF